MMLPSQIGRKQVSIQRGHSSGSSGFVTLLALPCNTTKSLGSLHKVDYMLRSSPLRELIGLSENADAKEAWFFTEAVERPSKYKPPKVLGHLASTIAQHQYWFRH